MPSDRQVSASSTRDADYRYDRFTTRLLLRDLRFHRGGLAPGDPLRISSLTDARGEAVRLSGVDRPVLLVTGSVTCPMTASGMPTLLRLHQEFGDRVDFVLVSGREAHPGESYPQPKTEGQARERARTLQSHHDVPFAVVVDSVDGRLHRLLDGKPNAAFVFDRDGLLVFRALWSSDERLRGALEAVAAGQRPPTTESNAMLRPMTRAIGSVDDVIRHAGRSARRDLWRSAAPMALAGRVAAGFSFLPSAIRGAIGLGVTMLAMAAVLAAALWLLL